MRVGGRHCLHHTTLERSVPNGWKIPHGSVGWEGGGAEVTVSCWGEICRLCCFIFLCVPIACSVLLGSAAFLFHLELSWDLMGRLMGLKC